MKATLVKPDVVAFELKYRFTKGEPDKFYACVFAFPGTANHGERRMDSWELKTEGVIKDTVKLFKPPAKTFEVYMTESPSPMLQYKKISNTVSGPVQPGS